MVTRLILILLWTVIAMLVQLVLLVFPGKGKEKFARIYWRGVGFLLGLKLTIRGDLAAERPVLFIANHCAWLDIVALGSALPGCFVAKSAVATWPLISWIARLGRTVFVSRSRGGVARERDELQRRLAKGDNIILFPEGTTSDGARVMPFSPAFLALAFAPARPCVQPVTLVYDEINFMPIHFRDRPLVSWYGDMELASHYSRLGRARSIHATIILDEPIPPEMFGDRKALSAALEARIAHNAACLRQGRGPAAPVRHP